MKFEEDIKRKFNKREITPSAAAWERVSSQLNKEKKKSGNYLIKYALAAGFAGLLVALNLFLFETNNNSITDSIVETSPTNFQPEQNRFVEEKITDSDSSSSGTWVQTKKSAIIRTEPKPVQQKQVLEKPEEEDLVRTQEVKMQPEPSVKHELNQPTRESIDSIANSLLASVMHAEENGIQVQDATIDSLLEQARNRIVTRRIFKSHSGLTAAALLEDVEQELDQSFRERVFDALKQSYARAREAVVSRNR